MLITYGSGYFIYLTILQYSSLLDIKQKQANVDESRLARSQVDATAAQGRAIMVFTVFTIIFVGLTMRCVPG